MAEDPAIKLKQIKRQQSPGTLKEQLIRFNPIIS